MVQIESAQSPFTSPRVAFQALQVLVRAEAMGLLPEGEHFDRLDLQAFRKAVRNIQRAGIARQMQLDLSESMAGAEAGLEAMLKRLNGALEESPAPEFEWNRTSEVLGPELLAKLLGISGSSLRRYKAAARSTPDDVAGKLHFLSLVAGDLGGAYNDLGIRQWFERKRVQLGGRSPRELLDTPWNPGEPAPSRIRDLARSLVASPAT